MKKLIFPLLFLSVLLFSCTSDDETIDETECLEGNNEVNMSRFVKSDSKSNGVSNSYTYNELNHIATRKRTSPKRIYEYQYVYDCSNNIVEVKVDETADPQYDGSNSYFEYDTQNRLIAYKNSIQGKNDYSLAYDADDVTVTGTFWNGQTGTIILQLDSEGKVVRLDRDFEGAYYEEITYTLFEYDTNGNLTKADDYDLAGELINSISINYDAYTNPYYDQFKSVYFQRFIQVFSEGGYWASDVINSDEFIFPYLPNNIVSVVDNLCNACYPEVVERVYTYDEQAYPGKFSLSYWGAPGTETEVEYD